MVKIIVSAAVIVSSLLGVLLFKISPDPTPGQVTVLTPNGGEKFIQGATNTISWSGGNSGYVDVGLAKANASTDFDIASAGLIVGWINKDGGLGHYGPNGSAEWDGKRVCDMGNTAPEQNCRNVAPGNYKIIVWSEDANGSMYIANGRGKNGKYTPKDYKGNWDLSDQTFTISSQ